MDCRHDLIELASSEQFELIDITDAVRRSLAASGLRDGLVTLTSRHTTARLNVNENEARLQQDMVTFLRRIAPPEADYLHNLDTVDDRPNAHAHLLGLFVNASEVLQVRDGSLQLGTWQSVFFVELDGPRPRRQVLMQCLGLFEDGRNDDAQPDPWPDPRPKVLDPETD